MHQVVALALAEVVAFDLAIPAQVFGHRDEWDKYSFTLCAVEPGLVPSTTGYSVQATRGLEALAAADTVVVPGYAPAEPPALPVIQALRAAADRGRGWSRYVPGHSRWPPPACSMDCGR